MKLVLAFVLAAVASAIPEGKTNPADKAPKKNRVVSPLVVSRHSDEWCHLHHHGAGASGCTKHPGCSYSRRVDKLYKKKHTELKTKKMSEKARDKLRTDLDTHGPCHSSDHHSDEWCNFFGSTDTKSCVMLSMCTWKVGAKKKGGGRHKGICHSKIRDTDFPKNIAMECYKNMGQLKAKGNVNADKDYVAWKKCVDASLSSPGGKDCYKMECFKNPNADCFGKRIKGKTITPKSLWFPKNKPCDKWKNCGRATNRFPNARCEEGYGFLWELPSKDPLANGKKNNKIGTHKFGCREKYNYKARCEMKAIKRCTISKGQDGKKKVCDTTAASCKGGKDICKATKEMRPSKKYAATQADEDRLGFDGYFCVDEQGHEIPDTRKMRPVELFDINCNIQRQKHEGMQCPNAVTLTTRGGRVVVNKRRGKKRDCAVHCNSDTDCKGEKWCCFNGCGYKCKVPVKPLSGCASPPGTKNGQIASGSWTVTDEKGRKAGRARHGIKIEAKCSEGWAQIPSKMKNGKPVMPIQKLDLTCEHGSWVFCPKGKQCIKGEAMEKLLVCRKDCPEFQLVDETRHIVKRDAKGKPIKKKGKIVTETVTIKATVAAVRSGKDLYSETRPMRNRDVVETKRSGFSAYIGDMDKMRHHSSSRTIACPPGYGAVQHQKFLGQGRWKGKKKSPRSMHIVRHGYETLTCRNGVWDPRHLECSVCYDAYEWQWRDVKGNSCAYYRSRPLLCHNEDDQTIKTFKRAKDTCGKFTAEWAEQGMYMLEKNMINGEQYRAYFQPWGEIALFKDSKVCQSYGVSKKRCKTIWKKPRGRSAGKKNTDRPCRCLPHFQPAYSDKLKNEPTSPPSKCGQITRGKKVFINPRTGKKFKGKQFKQGFFYMQQNSFGSAVENCRVACRSCEQAESKYLLRTRYTPEEFKMLIKEGKIKKKNVAKKLKVGGTDSGKGKWKLVKRRVLEWTKVPNTKVVKKTISKSYPISKVCTDGKGHNFLKCQGRKDPRPICQGKKKQIQRNGCKKGFRPMA